MKKNLECLAVVALLGLTGSTAWSQQEAPKVAPAVAPAGAPAGGAIRPPGGAPTAAGLTQRWEAIGNLLERSSSARHIEKEGSAESKQLQLDARAARAKAKQAIDDGELDKADALLRSAANLMFKAERASRSPEMRAEKAKADFNSRRDSVQTLLQTGRRLAGEEHATRPEFAQAEDLVKEADKLVSEGKPGEGRAKLDQAYGLIKAALVILRDKKEVKADKNFATKADEYKYEQGRNDDYRGLIADIVEGKDSSWSDVAKLGTSLREEADGLARANDHETALKKINESTNKFKSLLRRSGFPIL